MKHLKSLRVSLALLLSLVLSLPVSSVHADWQFESDNDRSGLSAYGSSFWAQGYGPVTYGKLMNLDMDEGDLWAAITVSCIRKRLYVSIRINQVGSGNQEIRLDDPGYVGVTISGVSEKRYRTEGSDYKDTLFIKSNDSKVLVKAMLGKSFLVVSPRIKSMNQRVRMLFDISSLSKGKTRFRYAGCPF